MSLILVVDDELSMREFLELMLVKDGYTVDCAEDGKTAGKMIGKTVYDLVKTRFR